MTDGFQAIGLISSLTARLVITIISYGFKPLDEGAKDAASMMLSILACGTLLPFMALVA
jgi:hypothetical protein